jgi:hypothetical protein
MKHITYMNIDMMNWNHITRKKLSQMDEIDDRNEAYHVDGFTFMKSITWMN